MPDENRVFDVSKPSRVSPPPTSRPVIVGHHPMNDPMVTGEGGFGSSLDTPSPTKIAVADADQTADGVVTVGQAMDSHQAAKSAEVLPEPASPDSPAIFHEPEEPEPDNNAPEPPPAQNVADGPFTAVEPEAPAQPAGELPTAAPPHEPHIEGLHFAPPRQKGGRGKWVIGGLLALLIAVYLLIDAGVFGSGINLPFHIFKKKSPPTATQTAGTAPPVSTGPAIPAGYKKYQLADTNLTFAAPTAWGTPTSTTDPGYTQRGGANQPSGTYAYLVNFSVNKDVQIAVTSAKLLPATRAPLYYDYLQWCTGTSDNKIYQSVLNFSTANKVDTPTTVTCDQGPISATVINSTTIVQPKATDSTNKVVGDVYTMNLTDPSLVVFRVKDAAMSNGDDIKQMLSTVQVSSSVNPSPSASSPNSSSSSNNSAGQ